MIDVQIGIANHVGEQECLDFLQRSVGLPFVREMRDAVKAVVHELHFRVGNHGFFGVVPHQPDAVSVASLAAQLIGYFKQKRAG